jgi:hypothetical protein
VGDFEQDAVAGQLAEMRERLLQDAVLAGTAEEVVTAAIDEVAADYANAPVTSFIGVLVEREVRTRLDLRPHTQNGTG